MNKYQNGLITFIADTKELDGKAVTKVINGVKHPSDDIFKRLSVEIDMPIHVIDIALNLNYN